MKYRSTKYYVRSLNYKTSYIVGMKVFLFITSFFLALSGFGQDQYILIGYVPAIANSNAIVSASVYFDESTIGTITDESGYFCIKNPRPPPQIFLLLVRWATKPWFLTQVHWKIKTLYSI